MWKESAYLPEVALGFRDIGGTGLFSSEYLVASKRHGDLDFSLGIGWGYMGSSGNIGNPFNALSSRFKTRVSETTWGGANFGRLFRGPAALFGGVQWRTPWDPLTLKLEYEGNDYKNEPLNNAQPQRSPIWTIWTTLSLIRSSPCVCVRGWRSTLAPGLARFPSNSRSNYLNLKSLASTCLTPCWQQLGIALP